MSLESVEIICGVDIGGSHLGVGLYSYNGCVLLSSHEESIHSLLSVEVVIQKIITIIEKLKQALKYQTSLISIGIGIPGQSKNGILVAASNFPNWKMVPLVSMISLKLENIPAVLINDADAAIAAEVWGADRYRNTRHAAMISKIHEFLFFLSNFLLTFYFFYWIFLALGTGIGFGLILDGRLYSGANGLIEGGHLVISFFFFFLFFFF